MITLLAIIFHVVSSITFYKELNISSVLLITERYKTFPYETFLYKHTDDYIDLIHLDKLENEDKDII